MTTIFFSRWLRTDMEVTAAADQIENEGKLLVPSREEEIEAEGTKLQRKRVFIIETTEPYQI